VAGLAVLAVLAGSRLPGREILTNVIPARG
jgi:hypothetical protein